jgi:tetrathionate reductase subunit B
MKCLIIDIKKCIGCYNCQIACKDEHVGNDWPPYTKPQPDKGQFWMKITEVERGTLPRVKVDWIPRTCMQCEDAPCAIACNEHAIFKRDDGVVMIDPGKCKGSQKCLTVCPHNAIYFNKEYGISQKCTMCVHLLDQGWDEPRCVKACPTGALIFGDHKELHELIDQADILRSEKKPNPKSIVYYLGMPKRFIAGEIYCPTEEKCLEGVNLALTNLVTGEKRITKTNNYGDFWLEDLDKGEYSLVIEIEGYYPKEIRSIYVEKDVDLGDIEIMKRT